MPGSLASHRSPDRVTSNVERVVLLGGLDETRRGKQCGRPWSVTQVNGLPVEATRRGKLTTAAAPSAS
jgi:hypothetical protein